MITVRNISQIRRNNTLSLALLTIIILTAYFNALSNSFVWEDEYLVVKNIFIRNVQYIKVIFTNNLFYFYKNRPTDYYRPIQTLSYLFDYHLWKLNPFGYHLSSIIIHILNSILVYFLIKILFKDQRLSLLTSLFFAICPLHVSVVTYISGRADLLVTFFTISGLLLFIKFIREYTKLYYFGSLICFILALLSKESALVFPFILLLTYKVYKKSNDISSPQETPLSFVPFFTFAIIYLVLKVTILNFGQVISFNYLDNFLLKLTTFFQIIFAYLKLIFLPTNLYMQHKIQMANNIFSPFALLSFINIVFILVIIIKTSKRSKVIFWSLSWFLINLLPLFFVMFSYQSSYNQGTVMMAEHWLYIPLIGFFTFLSFLIRSLKKIRPVNLIQSALKKIVIFPMALLIFYIFETIIINRDYKNSESLFNKILQYAPDNINARVNLPKFYLEQGNLDKAITGYTELLKLNKDLSYLAHSGLGTTYFTRGNFQEALKEYGKAIEDLKIKNKKECRTRENLRAEILAKMGIVYFYKGLYPEAENELRQAIQVNPQDAASYGALGVVYAQKGQYGEAIININKSLEVNPFNAEPYNNLGLVYAHIGNTAKAKEMWQKAIRINPDFIEARRNIQWAEGINK